jgi:hypothetical protein
MRTKDASLAAVGRSSVNRSQVDQSFLVLKNLALVRRALAFPILFAKRVPMDWQSVVPINQELTD